MTDIGLVEERIETLLADAPPDSTPFEEFRRRQFELGLAWIHFPQGKGGLGAYRRMQSLVDARLAEAGFDDRSFYMNGVGLNLVAPALIEHGTEEQQDRFLRPLFTCEEIWCQLFSEPGAGSDLAGLGTSAVETDGGWRASGQKVWTTLAHRADYGFLLARTDPTVPKHVGITAFVVDMHEAGIEVRGIREITGEYEFNEVFLDGAFIPAENRIGDVGGGWRVALTLLSEERVAYFGDVGPRNSGPIGTALELWRQREEQPPSLRDDLVRLWMRAEALRLTNARIQNALQTDSPGPEGSIVKVEFAECTQSVYEFCLELAGGMTLEYPDGYAPIHRDDMSTMVGRDYRKMYLRGRALSIEGGTSEIMRNIIGERVLGLPKEPRVDVERPWEEVRRS